MTVYAVTYSDKKPGSITRGKRYKVDRETAPRLFYITADNGNELACLWYDCAHLGGGSWTRIEEEDDMAERITLQKGDYVSTKGLTEDDYRAVARAFMAAGAESGEYPDSDFDLWEYFGWNDSPNALEFWDKPQAFGDDSRHLIPQQVVNATNAGGQTQDPLTTILEQAAEHDATAKHHAAMHERLMAEAGEMLPGGWRLVHDTEPGTDMSDPENWREGDVLERADYGMDITKGNLYVFHEYKGPKDIVLKKDDVQEFPVFMPQYFRFAYRP